jgi:hypothetical protein
MATQDYRRRRKLQGLCISCPKPPVYGRTLCAECYKKARVRRHLTGLSKEEMDKASCALDSFEGLCQCCGSTDKGTNHNWCLDHDHVRSKFRGVICDPCNMLLGWIENHPEKLIKVLAYKSSFESVPSHMVKEDDSNAGPGVMGTY